MKKQIIKKIISYYKRQITKLLIIKKIKRNYQIEQKSIMKITKKDCKSKQKINVDNYLTRKKQKKRIWKKQISKYV